MTMRRLILAAASLSIAACATASTRDTSADDRQLAQAIDGRVAGKPQNCIEISRVQGPEAIGDRTVVYRQSGRRVWISHLQEACPALRGDRILIVRSFGNQICRLDRFDLVSRDSPIPSGFCFFGDFTPYDRAPKR